MKYFHAIVKSKTSNEILHPIRLKYTNENISS